MKATKSSQSSSQKSSSSCFLVAFIVILVVMVLIGMIVLAGFFGLKMLGKNTGKETVSKNIVSQLQKKIGGTSSTNKLISGFAQTFVYPQGNVTEVNRDTSYGAAYTIYEETSDDVQTVYDYYEKLATVNGWTLGSRGIDMSGTSGSLRLSEPDFSADLSYERKDGGVTLISIDVYAEDPRLSQVGVMPGSQPVVTSTPTGTPVRQVPSPSVATQVGVFVIPDSNVRKVTEADLSGLTPWQLKVARNELYARYGRPFVHKDLACYFQKQSWYVMDPSFTESRLSSIEQNNAVIILNYEKKIQSPLMNVDSGCR